MMPSEVPALTNDDVHVWHGPWPGGRGESHFAALLAAYTRASAPEVLRGIHGKPYFASPRDDIGFSWSHSADMAVLAIGRGRPSFQLGVDVEAMRPRSRVLELSRRFFTTAEASMLDATADDRRLGTFLALWTAKEAVLKAHGGGISYGLHRVGFRMDGSRAVPLAFEGDIGPASDWSVSPLALPGDSVATVAWRGKPRRLHLFTYPF